MQDRLLYENIFREFESNGIEYVVIGGFALNLHGIPRMTADLDLIVSLTESNLKKTLGIMESLGYEPRLPVAADSILDPLKRKDWLERRNLIGFSFIHPDFPDELIDLMIHKDERFADYYSKRKMVPILDFNVPIIDLDHLKELKEETGRKQDIADLQMIYTLEKMIAEDNGVLENKEKESDEVKE